MLVGTVAAGATRAATGLEPFTAAAVAGLARADLVHADETPAAGSRTAGDVMVWDFLGLFLLFVVFGLILMATPSLIAVIANVLSSLL